MLKLMAMAMAVMMMFSLSACGGENDEGDSAEAVTEYLEKEPAEEISEEYPAWKEAYAVYLEENQDRSNHQLGYKNGEGRFALADITGDEIPELFIITSFDRAFVYTYRNDIVENVLFASGSSDIFSLDLHSVRIADDGNFYEKLQWDNSEVWNIYTKPETEEYDFVLNYKVGDKGGVTFFNEYDVNRVMDEGFGYVAYDFEDAEVSREEYEKTLDEFGLYDSEFETINEIYGITPEDIDAVLR